jgi:uncharacterized protein (DUF362 family)
VTVLVSGRRPLDEAFRQTLDAWWTDLDWARGVFLKPNIVFPAKPESGEITPPGFVATLIQVLRERAPELDIVMGDGVAIGRDPQDNFRASGFARLSREANVPLVDLHETERRSVAWQSGELKIPCVALDRVYINLPVLKYSSACVISGALKNQKGLLTPGTKKQFHKLGLHEQIADLNTAVRPSLTILDCSRFFGPDTLIAGDNCGEVDAMACRLLEIDEPEHVRLAGISGLYAAGFPVLGDETEFRRTAPRPQATEAKRLGRLRLWSNSQACTGCRAVFLDAKAGALRPHSLRTTLKLLKYSALGAEMVMGLNPHWRKKYKTVICVGTCTQELAGESGYTHIPGCPPMADDLGRYLR